MFCVTYVGGIRHCVDIPTALFPRFPVIQLILIFGLCMGHDSSSHRKVVIIKVIKRRSRVKPPNPILGRE